MSAPSDSPLAPRRVAQHLRPRRRGRWRLTGGGVTGSTNDDAKELGRAGDLGGVAVLATEQTAGRGRFDRTWQSPGGGVYLSALVRPELDPAAAGVAALTAGLGVVTALSWLDAALAGSLSLKWPNDVLAHGGKLAGVLVESSVNAGRLEWLVIGIGINVLREPGTAPDGRTFISDLVDPGSLALEPARVAAAVLDVLKEDLALLTTPGEGFVAMLPEYQALSADVGRAVVVRDRAGEIVAEGLITGFDAEGALLLSTASGPQRVTAGEVTLRG